MEIGILPEPLDHPLWPAISALLEPAAKRGGVPVLEAGEQVWIIHDGKQLLGAATARPTLEGFGEVVLVGGRNCRQWIGELDCLIGEWLKAEGMTSVRAAGRRGWVRILKDWHAMKQGNKIVSYMRTL